jgi:formate dehydrogenase iron-sulfur subunit
VTQAAADESQTLIDRLLEEQRELSAVERFSQKHEKAEIPLQSRYYRDLLPLTRPAEAEQYAFEVDLDKCSGCKACVAACHSLNGLEPGESWRSVGLLVADDPVSPIQQTVTTACHHCVDPACLNGCPVLAYEKDSVTGIVKHLDDQCIGCQYCVLKCPYEVPQFSSRLGIVRKCDMCSSRLSAGEAPACVQACPSAAIRITIVQKAAIQLKYSGQSPLSVSVENASGTGAPTRTGNSFLAATPDPAYTLPTTRYVSAKGLPSQIRAGDEMEITPAAPHWPLIGMLVLTQAGLGGLIFETFFSFIRGTLRHDQVGLSGILVLAGVVTSIFHLGRPLQAWRAVLGVRRSWLSREILGFGAVSLGILPLLAAGVWPFLAGRWETAVLMYCSIAGALTLFSSMMVYVDTPREFWALRRTLPKFAGTTLLLGAAISAIFHGESSPLFAAISAVAIAKFSMESGIFRRLADPEFTALKRSALLMMRDLSRVTLFRFGTLLAGGVLLAQLCFAQGSPIWWIPPLILVVLFLSEVAERYLFFRAVAQPKMPGGLA